MKTLWKAAALAAAIFASHWAPVSAAEINIVSDTSWRYVEVEWPDWQSLGYDDSTWQYPLALAVQADYPEPPASYIPGTLGVHIWPMGPPSTVWFRQSFILSGIPQASQAVVRVDGSFDFHFNGQWLASGTGILSCDLTRLLRPGLNVFAIKAWNSGSTPAFLFDAKVNYQPYPGAWHFEFEGEKPVRLVWPTEAGREYHLRVSNNLSTWSPAPRFPKTAAGGTLACEFVPEEKGFFKIEPLPAGFALIPGGNFQMGDSFTEGGSEELPTHGLFISPFHMGKTEVTGALWAETRTWGLSHGYTDLPAGSSKGGDHPVHSISWQSMVKWCNALSEKYGLVPCYRNGGEIYRTGGGVPDWEPGANGYRLPTEAEWEKAARGGLSGRRFPWGDIINHSQANYFNSGWPYESPQGQGHHPAYATGGEPYTAPVASFPANPYGMYDMAGNLWESCWDSFSANYYTSSPAIDPRGPAPSADRAIRGGNWDNHAGNAYVCRVSVRTFIPMTDHSNGHGFRLARNAVPDEFTLIPAGSFQMGDAFAEGRDNEQPVQQISTGAFYMAKYELTKPLWDEVRTWGLAHGYTDLPMGESKGPGHPLRAIQYWQQAAKWCNARSEMEGLAPCYTVGGQVYQINFETPDCDWNANGYRLPSEVEWEKAARGGLPGKRFPWGDTISHLEANYFSTGTDFGNIPGTTDYHPAFDDGIYPYTSPVGSFAPNGYGLYDMTGNVWEWCWNTAYRGGACMHSPFHNRVAYRGFYDGRPGAFNSLIGLRLVRTSVP